MALADDTISGNSAPTDAGGAIFAVSGSTSLLTNVTISNNSAVDGGGILGSGGDVILSNTIVAGNFVSDASKSNDVQGALDATSAYNLIGDGTGMTGLVAANHNKIGTGSAPINSFLSPLGNYGGPTQTMVLLLGSPAVDAGGNSLAVGPDGNSLTLDQRGMPRIVNALNTGVPTVDIGATEAPALPASLTFAATLLVNTSADSLDQVPDPARLSLRDAVGIANINPATRAINFAPSISTIKLTNGAIELAATVNIQGPGAGSLSISGNDMSRVFQVDGTATAAISGITITGGHAPDGSTGVPADPNNFLNPNGGPGGTGSPGGAVFNDGKLILSGCVISGNIAGSGGIGGAPGENPIIVHRSYGGNGGFGGDCGGIYSVGVLTILASSIHDNRGGAGGAGGRLPRVSGIARQWRDR